MSNNTENNGLQYLTYGTLRSAADGSKLNFYYSISEFIDNSISSYLIQKEKDSDTAALTIEIWQDIVNGEKKLYILDNAYGMNKDQLSNSMKLNKISNKGNQIGYNRYGRGMKDAIFWLGKDGEVITQEIGNKKIKGLFCAVTINNGEIQEKPANENVCIEIIDENDDEYIKEHGTLVIVKYPRTAKRGLCKENIKKLKDFLGFRYCDFLKKEEVKIYIYDEKQKSFDDDQNEVKAKDIWNLNDYSFKLSDEQKQKFDKNYPTLIKQTEKWDENPNFQTSSYDVIEKIKNNEKLIFTTNLSMCYEANKKLQVKSVRYMFLEKPDKNKSGVAIKHNGRFIRHTTPNITDTECGLFKYCAERELDGYWRWIYYEIDLANIEGNERFELIEPDANKTSLNFNGCLTVEDFKTFFCNITKGFKNLIEQVLIPYSKPIERISDDWNNNIFGNLDDINENEFQTKDEIKINGETLPIELKIKIQESEFFENENVLFKCDESEMNTNNYLINNKYVVNEKNPIFADIKPQERLQLIKLLNTLDSLYKRKYGTDFDLSKDIETILDSWTKENENR